MAVKNADGTWTSTSTKGGITTTNTYDANNKLISSTTSNKRSGSSSSKSSSGERVASVDYMNSDGTISTLPKSMAEQMDRNRTDGKSGIVAGSESWDKMTLGTDYRRGGTYTDSETAYDFVNKNTGEKKTTYSDFTNYQDAMAKAGLGDDWKLSTAVTYRQPNKTSSGYVADTSEGGFADNALKTVQAADYLYGNNSSQLDESTRKYLEGIINGTVSTAGVNFGDATTYNGLLNGSTSKGTYDNLNFNYLKGLLENNTPAPKTVTDDMMTTAEYQTYANSLKGNTAPTGSTAYTDDVNLYNSVGGYGDMNFNVGNNYGVPAYNGLTADDIKDVYGSIWGAQEQSAANNMALYKALADSRRNDTNEAYDEVARQAYVQSMLNQNNLPQMLKAQGLSGGASESSQLAQQLNYENIINSNETDRAKALRDIEQSLFEAQVESDNNLLQLQAGLQQDMLGSLQSAINAETAFNQWVAEYNMARTEADRDYALKQAQLAKAEQEEAEARAWEYATLAAEYGDYSQLQALGVNPAVKSTPISGGDNEGNDNDKPLFNDDDTPKNEGGDVAAPTLPTTFPDVNSFITGEEQKVANILIDTNLSKYSTADEQANELARMISTGEVTPIQAQIYLNGY